MDNKRSRFERALEEYLRSVIARKSTPLATLTTEDKVNIAVRQSQVDLLDKQRVDFMRKWNAAVRQANYTTDLLWLEIRQRYGVGLDDDLFVANGKIYRKPKP